MTLDIQSAGGNRVAQNDQTEYFIDRKCDIVCINLVDRTDASTIIERGKLAIMTRVGSMRLLFWELMESERLLQWCMTDICLEQL